MVDFKKLKANSGQKSLEAISAEMAKLNTAKSSDDERFWRPTVDKAGNGYAVIRFLPAVDGETVPYIRYWDHGFQGPGGWYIEKSLTTIGLQDPASEHNSKLWATGIEANKKLVSDKLKRRLHYVSNIQVISDSGNPAAEGNNYLFTYGKKIFDKCNEAMHPQFADETPLNPFDFWAGANFKLKIRKVDGYSNYDRSEFDKPSPLFEDDDKLEALWKKQYPLLPIIDKSQFKTYDELKERLNRVLSEPGSKAVHEDAIPETPAREERVREAPKAPEKTMTVDEDDDDELNYFKKLAN